MVSVEVRDKGEAEIVSFDDTPFKVALVAEVTILYEIDEVQANVSVPHDASATGGGVLGSVVVTMVVCVGKSARTAECDAVRGSKSSVIGNGCRNSLNELTDF